MKLNHRTVVLGLVVLAVIAAGLGFVRSQREGEREEAAQALAAVQVNLSKFQVDDLLARQAQLGEKIDQATLDVKTREGQFGKTNSNIELTDSVYKLAGDSSVQILSFNAADATTGKLGAVPLSMVKLTFQAT